MALMVYQVSPRWRPQSLGGEAQAELQDLYAGSFGHGEVPRLVNKDEDDEYEEEQKGGYGDGKHMLSSIPQCRRHLWPRWPRR